VKYACLQCCKLWRAHMMAPQGTMTWPAQDPSFSQPHQCVRATCAAVQLWWAHKGAEGGDQELWRGTQMWFWMAPNHLRAIAKVLWAESSLCGWMGKMEVGRLQRLQCAGAWSWAALHCAATAWTACRRCMYAQTCCLLALHVCLSARNVP
jgi:hypothetical protein